MWGLAVQSSLIAVICSAAMAVALLLRARKSIHLRFGAFSLSIGAYYMVGLLGRVFYESALVDHLSLVAGGMVVLAAGFFFDALLSDAGLALSRIRLVIRVGACVIVVMGLTPVATKFWVRAALMGFATLLLSLHAGNMWYQAGKMDNRADRMRLRYLTYAGLATLAMFLLDLLSAFYWAIPAIGGFAVSIYLYFILQTLLVSRLLDLHEVLGRAAVFAVLALTLAGIYGALIRWAGDRPGLFWFNTLAATSLTLILFDPLRSALERWAARLFFRKQVTFARQLRATGQELVRFVELAPAVSCVLDRLYESKRATCVSVYLLDPARWEFVLQAHRGPQPALVIGSKQYPVLFRHVLEDGSPLFRDNVQRQLLQNRRQGTAAPSLQNQWQLVEHEALLEGLVKVRADIVIPLQGPDSVVGFLSLQDDRVKEPYSKDEVAALVKLGEQLAVTVQNSQVVAVLKERDRLAALGEMSTGLAHEVRNPLAAIKGAAQTLDPTNLPQEEAELLHIIVDEVNRLNNVVKEFLEYARPFQALLTPVDLNDVVRKTLQLFQHDLPDTIELQVSLQENLPTVQGDAQQLRQVLLNLLINAKHAVGTKGLLRVRTQLLAADAQGNESDSNKVQLFVQDSGKGVPQHVREKIFIPFFTTKETGTGLGLSVCQRIIRHHRGRIDLHSSNDTGTTFLIELPAQL
ncbi:MAG: ATP-binding protein [Myxococcota bacterium]